MPQTEIVTADVLGAGLAAVNNATSAPTANQLAKRDGSGRLQVATPATAADVATKGYVDGMVSGGGAGSTAATPNTIAQRDAAGRLAVATPAAAGDAATKGYVDGAVTGDSAATAGALARRDAAGRLAVATPAAAGDAATKGYTDSLVLVTRRLVSNAQAAAYTFALTDEGELVYSTGAAATTFTVPPNSTAAFPVGGWIDLMQAGAGALSIAAGAGVTVLSPGGRLQLRTQYARARLVKVATDTWYLDGQLLDLDAPAEATYLNGFVAYVDGVAQWNGLRWWRRNGIVTISGAIKNTAGAAARTAVANLPAGWAPPFSVQAYGGAGNMLVVWTDGTIRNSNTWAAGSIDSFTVTYALAS